MTTTPIVALDVSTSKVALDLVDDLGEACRFFKVGAELFTASGPSVIREVQARGAEVFLDLKYHDIPNTVAGGVRAAAALGVRLVTVHAVGGPAMLRAAVDGAGDQGRCGVLAVKRETAFRIVAGCPRTWREKRGRRDARSSAGIDARRSRRRRRRLHSRWPGDHGCAR